MAQRSDEQLMVAFQNGNVDAFEFLFQKYRGPLFNFLYRMLNGQREQAEDLLQDVFLKIISARDFYEPKGRFSTWLFAIARNHCLNAIKSQRYREHVAPNTSGSDPDGGSPAKETAANDANPFEAAEQADDLEALERVVRALPEAYREVFLLHAVEGFSHPEVSDILKTNAATVRTRYRRATALLREGLRNRFAQGE